MIRSQESYETFFIKYLNVEYKLSKKLIPNKKSLIFYNLQPSTGFEELASCKVKINFC